MDHLLEMQPLSASLGVEIGGVDLTEVSAGHLYPAIRDAFETHSLLLFRDQQLTPAAHVRLARLFGPLEERYPEEREAGQEYAVPQISNVDPGAALAGEAELKLLNLQANMLWHTDSTFLPVPALTNIATARIVPSEGGATEFAGTRAAFRDLPPARQSELREMRLWHRYAHSRAQISARLARLPMFNKWEDQLWPALWRNPVNGLEAIYVASHAFAVDGMDDEAGAETIRELIETCTRPEYVYTHRWRVGDVLIWDERATLHRGTPWPYEQARTLSSICSSAGVADGLAEMLSARG